MNFFDKVPTISYNGQTVKNIFARATISDQTKSNRLVYYPYTVKEDDTIDGMSNNYYDSPKYMWLIWMSNDVVDPYYDLALNQDDFLSYIEAKYGSADVAMSTIKCYRNNWYDNGNQISKDQYALLAPNYFKYYDPVVNNDYQVLAYKRKQYDDIVTTNMSIGVTLDRPVSYNFDDSFKADNNNFGYVSVSDGSNYVIIQHITGSIAPGDVIDGATVTDVVQLSQTIAWTDSMMWSSVTNYEYEVELNEAKKSIHLIDARYRDTVESELQSILNT